MEVNTNDLNKELVRKHFNRHAFEYDRFSEVQSIMADRLIMLLREQYPDSTFNNILELGCGTGILTEKLLNLFPGARITAVDISPAMINKTKEKLVNRTDSVTYLTGDAELMYPTILTGERFDLVISNAVFQWFTQPKATIQAYVNHLFNRGVLAFATFGPRTFFELHESYHAAEELLSLSHPPHGLSFGDRAYWARILDPLFWQQEVYRVYFPTVRDFLYSVKRIGAGNSSRGRGASGGVSGKGLLAAMESIYTTRFQAERGIQATYDLSFGLYRK
jgi:malonyl-CoA O-methyltransferase